MKKILIIGSCGSGKSTLAKQLSKKLNLSLVSLDQCYWKPKWTPTQTQEWRNKVTELVKKDKWIIDGNFKNTLDIRIPASDTIIWLEINRFVCFWRVLKRRLLKNRVDKLNNCQEKIGFRFIKWILWDYSTKGRKKILHFLKKYNNKKVIIIKSKKDLKNLLINL